MKTLAKNQVSLGERISQAANESYAGERVTLFGGAILAHLWWAWSPFGCLMFGAAWALLHWLRRQL